MIVIRVIQEQDAEEFLLPRRRLDEETQFMTLKPGERLPTVQEQRKRMRGTLQNESGTPLRL